jgi:hypothetical protein
MKRASAVQQILPIALVAALALAPFYAKAEGKFSLHSVSADLPFGDRMFQGPGSDAANNNCLACHSVGMVLNQPVLSRAQWLSEVEKMRTAYKAPIDPKDVNTIVDYLVKINAAK